MGDKIRGLPQMIFVTTYSKLYGISNDHCLTLCEKRAHAIDYYIRDKEWTYCHDAVRAMSEGWFILRPFPVDQCVWILATLMNSYGADSFQLEMGGEAWGTGPLNPECECDCSEDPDYESLASYIEKIGKKNVVCSPLRDISLLKKMKNIGIDVPLPQA